MHAHSARTPIYLAIATVMFAAPVFAQDVTVTAPAGVSFPDL
jgi:hypothetical protein